MTEVEVRPLVRGRFVSVDAHRNSKPDDAFCVIKGEKWEVSVCIADPVSLFHTKREPTRQEWGQVTSKRNKRFLELSPDLVRPCIQVSVTLSKSLQVENVQIRKARVQTALKLTFKDVDRALQSSVENDSRYWRDCLELARGLHRRRGHSEGVDRASIIVQELMLLINSVLPEYFRGRDLKLLYYNQRGEDTATYSTENRGNQALRLSSYARFTSPLWRYEDFLNHLALHRWLNDEPAAEIDGLIPERVEVSRPKAPTLVERKQTYQSKRNDANFSVLVKCLQPSELTPELRDLIVAKLRATGVTNRVLAKLLFMKAEGELWDEVKAAALDWISENLGCASIVLSVGFREFVEHPIEELNYAQVEHPELHGASIRLPFENTIFEAKGFSKRHRINAQNNAAYQFLRQVVENGVKSG